MAYRRNVIASVLLILLGIAMVVIGVLGAVAPPILTGVGFGVLAWLLWPRREGYAVAARGRAKAQAGGAR